MGFNAAQVEALDYDFSSYPGASGQPWAVAGTVPEPTAARRDQFAAQMREILDLGDVGTGSREDITAAVLQIPIAHQQEITAAMRGALVELCAGSPAPEVIEALPFRLYDAFRDWLMGEMFVARPTMPSAATSASPATAAPAASPTSSAAA